MKDTRSDPHLKRLSMSASSLLDAPSSASLAASASANDRVETRRCLADAQADKADRGAPVEDDHENEAIRHDGEVHVVPLTPS